MKKGLTEQQFAWLILLPALILVFGIVLYPLFTTFLYSVQDMDLTSPQQGAFVGLKNYITVLSQPGFWASFGRTVYFSGVSLTLELILGILIALLLNQDFKGKAFLQSIIILPWAVPTIVNGAMWKWIYHPEYGAFNALLSQLHLISTYQSWLNEPWLAMNMVILADVWKMTPLVAIFCLASLQMVNKSVYEAAMVDGAGLFRRFFTLTLPYLKPTILVVIVMRTMDSIKVFDIIYAITKGGPANGTMVMTYEAYLRAFTNLHFSEGATISYLIGGFIALLTFVYVKVLKRGEQA